MNFLERCKNVFESVRKTSARIPTRVAVPEKRVDKPGKLGTKLAKDGHYFQVRVNEMFLANEREWFRTYYPMVFVASEFLYDRGETEIPFVLGPATLGPKVNNKTGDMIFQNTRVAGIHPYRGGRLNLSVVLYRVTEKNHAHRILNMVENLAGALDFSSAIVAYTKVAGALLDSVEMLTGMDETDPIMGYRTEIDLDAGDDVEPGYFALVDMSDAELRGYELRVRDDKLVHGPNLAEAEPFRAADYVLYSLASTTARSDIPKLQFYELWQRVLREAAVPTDESYASAKANMLSLYQTMLLSPDLLREHARVLAKEYSLEMKRTFEEAVDVANLGEGEDRPDELAAIRNESLGVLDL